MVNRRAIIPILFIVKNYSFVEQKINILNKIIFDSLGYENFAVDKCWIPKQHKIHTIKIRTKFKPRLIKTYA
jgi:hypothetical protein